MLSLERVLSAAPLKLQVPGPPALRVAGEEWRGLRGASQALAPPRGPKREQRLAGSPEPVWHDSVCSQGGLLWHPRSGVGREPVC